MFQQRTLSLALLPCLIAGALAAGLEKSMHPLTNLPPTGEIATGFFFPDYPTKQFPAGEEVKVVVGIRNDAAEAYNISSIMGSVNSPADFKTYIHNLTHQTYFSVVPSGAEVSFEYKFTPHPMLPPANYIVALTVFYEGKEGFKSTTFFNQTVEVVELPKLIDWDLIFLYLLLLAILAVLGYFLVQYLTPLGVFKSFTRKQKRSSETTVRTDTDDDWVKGTPYDLHSRKKKAAASKKAA